MVTDIPCMLMRGGTSKGAYFLLDDLPQDEAVRDRVLLRVMGSPDKVQIDGLGGADPLTSKVAIVNKSTREGVDVDYLFAQVVVDEARVDFGQNCGNLLAAVGPFAIERGLVEARNGITTVSIYMVNTGQIAVAEVSTPDGRVSYDGDARIDGVPGTASAVPIEFKDTAGSTCGALLPTGNVCDEIDGVQVTCIDNGMPVVLLRAADFGITGYESREELEANAGMKARVEAIRLKVGPMMKLGDVAQRTVPKMTLIAAPREGGAVCTRTLIPHRVHASIGVLGAVSVATAAVLPGSVADGLAVVPEGLSRRLVIEHPTGEFTVQLSKDTMEAPDASARAALLRTARLIMHGLVQIPGAVWDGKRG
jgi:4-oxalomesaconate tautomerase